MTNEQQLIWDLLQNNPAKLAHVFGRDLQELARQPTLQLFHRRCNQHLTHVMNNVSNHTDVLRIVCTWLSKYDLPMDPNQLPVFDRFHTTYGGHALKTSGQIKIFE